VSRLLAASRIVEIQGSLAQTLLGTETRKLLVEEQRELWDEHFLGKPFEDIARDAWMFKHLRH
jgi:hypothetical protein